LIGNIHADANSFPDAVSKISTRLKESQPPVFLLKSDGEPVLVLKLIRPKSIEDQIIEYIYSILPNYVPKICFMHETTNGKIMAQRAIKPVVLNSGKTVITLRDFLSPSVFSLVTKSEMQCLLKQIIYFLYQMQQADSQFTHNDLKCDNILLTESENDFQVIIIDFETVTTSEFHTDFDADPKTLADFGLGLEYSSYTDLHLVFLEIWNKLNTCKKQSWAYEFIMFTSAIFPLPFMQTYTEKGRFVTKCNRLNSLGRKYLKENKTLSLFDALEHPFLNK
jgi:serine/threonine protein kinase